MGKGHSLLGSLRQRYPNVNTREEAPVEVGEMLETLRTKNSGGPTEGEPVASTRCPAGSEEGVRKHTVTAMRFAPILQLRRDAIETSKCD